MYAHSVKNPQTIHLRREYREGEYHLDIWGTHRYLCCNSYTEAKATDDPLKATCLNCLRRVMRAPKYIQEEVVLYRRAARGIIQEAQELREDDKVALAIIKEDLGSRYHSIADHLEWVLGIREVL